MGQKKFIDIRRLIGSKNPRLLKWLPGFIIRYLERILHQDEINDFLEKHPHEKNQEFCNAVVRLFRVKIELTGLENIPKTGGATLAMNHPLGGLDALALVSAIQDHRQDIRFIVNDLLLQLEPLRDLFVGVNKHGKNSERIYQKIDELFSSDKLVCIFPAGLVSRKINGKVCDLEWKKTFVSLSIKSGNPIIPIYIEGRLSNFFYRLSRIRTFLRIKANIEMLYLSDEMFRQRGRTIRFVVGKPILASELDESKSHREWADEIRERLYALGK